MADAIIEESPQESINPPYPVVDHREKFLNSTVVSLTGSLAVDGIGLCAGFAERWGSYVPSNNGTTSAFWALMMGSDGKPALCGKLNPVSTLLSRLKQIETKTVLKYGAVMLPAAVCVTYDAIASTNWSGDKNKDSVQLLNNFQLHAKKHVESGSFKQMVFNAATIGLMFLTAGHRHSLRLKTSTFDASGHMMAVGCVGTLMVMALKQAEANSSPTAAKVARCVTILYGLTNAFMIYRTAACYHTVPELAAGALWATTIVGAAAMAAISAEHLKTRAANWWNVGKRQLTVDRPSG